MGRHKKTTEEREFEAAAAGYLRMKAEQRYTARGPKLLKTYGDIEYLYTKGEKVIEGYVRMTMRGGKGFCHFRPTDVEKAIAEGFVVDVAERKRPTGKRGGNLTVDRVLEFLVAADESTLKEILRRLDDGRRAARERRLAELKAEVIRLETETAS